MKRRLSVLIVCICFIMVFVTLLLPACAKEEPAAPAAPATPIPAEVQILKMADWHPANIPAVNSAFWVFRELERRSGGRIQWEYYYSGTLAGGKEMASAVRTGVADAAPFVPGYTPGEWPLCDVTFNPAITLDSWSGIMAQIELVETTPEVQAEFDANNAVYIGGTGNPNYNIISDKPIRTLEDLKGLKIVASGASQILLAEFGATPVNMVSTEVFQAIQRGTVNGNVNNPEYARVYNFFDVAPYWYNIPFGGQPFFTIMNKDTYNGLPQDLQDLLMDLRDNQAEANYMIYDVAAEVMVAWLKIQEKCEVIDPTPADVELFLKTAEETVWIEWVTNVEDSGLPGQMVMDKWRALNAKYQAMDRPLYIGHTDDKNRKG